MIPPINCSRAQEYWDNYGDIQHKHISEVRDTVLNFGELQVSTQRQWGMPLPILLCDQCDEPLTDKNTLNAIRNSIQRSFEFWFGLSIEELLPTDTRCLNCNSGDFRKEATLIDSHFANLLQVIDNSDFKKPLGGHTSVMFVPQTSGGDFQWTKWLAEISVISAALTRSRPIKESQPFKQLMLKTLPKIGGEIQIEDAFLNKYPADVVRLVAVSPTVETKQVSYKQLEKLADRYLGQYHQLQALFDDISKHLYPFLLDSQKLSEKEQKDTDAQRATATNEREGQTDFASAPTHTNLEVPGETATADKTLPMDSLLITVTAQLLQEAQQAYQTENFHKMWTMLTNFCQDDLRFYSRAMESRPTTTLQAAQSILSEITTLLLQRFAPLTPFLAEHFYRRISVEGITSDHSIFQRNWHSRSPLIGQNLQLSDTEKDEAKAEWEEVKRAYDAKKNPEKNAWQNVMLLIYVAIPMMILDWGTKWLVQKHITLGTEEIPVISGFFYLRHDRNDGAAFGVLAGHRVLLILITIVALVFIFAYYLRFRESRWMQVSLGFLLGGAVGNFIDRLYLGEVVDFLQFGIASQRLFWPTFNVADISVCIGAGMLIVYLFRHRNQDQQA